MAVAVGQSHKSAKYCLLMTEVENTITQLSSMVAIFYIFNWSAASFSSWISSLCSQGKSFVFYAPPLRRRARNVPPPPI